jgi:hypothetical protein
MVVTFIIKIILGLFIWMVVPKLIYNKRKYKKDTIQYFVFLSCKILGIALILYSVLNFINELFYY